MVYTVFHGFLRFVAVFCDFVAQRLGSGPRQTQNVKNGKKPYKPNKP